MTHLRIRERSARDTIAAALLGEVRPGYEFDVADAIIAAVLAMSTSQQAELIRGFVELDGVARRVITVWRDR